MGWWAVPVGVVIGVALSWFVATYPREATLAARHTLASYAMAAGGGIVAGAIVWWLTG